MLVRDFLHFLLEDALEEARAAHPGPSDRLAFEGAERALAECRAALCSEDPSRDLGRLLARAREDSEAATANAAPDQWFWFCREAQVEWIANVFSVILMNNRMPTIVPPTRPAAQAVARLALGYPAE